MYLCHLALCRKSAVKCHQMYQYRAYVSRRQMNIASEVTRTYAVTENLNTMRVNAIAVIPFARGGILSAANKLLRMSSRDTLSVCGAAI